MKTKFVTLAGVTVAAINTKLTVDIVKTVKGFKPEACKLFNDDKKLVFGLGLAEGQSFDGIIVNLNKRKGNLVYREVLVDATDKEKEEEKVHLVQLASKLSKVEEQVVAAYNEYIKTAASIEETNLDEVEVKVEVEEVEEESEEE